MDEENKIIDKLNFEECYTNNIINKIIKIKNLTNDNFILNLKQNFEEYINDIKFYLINEEQINEKYNNNYNNNNNNNNEKYYNEERDIENEKDKENEEKEEKEEKNKNINNEENNENIEELLILPTSIYKLKILFHPKYDSISFKEFNFKLSLNFKLKTLFQSTILKENNFIKILKCFGKICTSKIEISCNEYNFGDSLVDESKETSIFLTNISDFGIIFL
jgi:hypothetical protein